MSDIDLSYDLSGPETGPQLTFSHSLFADRSMWDPQMEVLGDYRILRFDTRGHGGSASTPGEYDFEMLADDARRLLDRLEINKTHFVGLSMGGMIGQALAIYYPERIQSLVLCDTRGHTPEGRRAGRAERIATVQREGIEPTVERCITGWFSLRFAAENPGLMDQVRDMIRRTSVDGLIGCTHAIDIHNYSPRLHEIAAPTLIIVGEDDQGTPVSEAKAMHERIPGSELVVLPEARHLSNMERPREFNDALVSFLSRHAG